MECMDREMAAVQLDWQVLEWGLHLGSHIDHPSPHQAEEERKKDILTSFKRPKWPIRPNKRLHLECCLVFENKSK